MRTYLWVWDIFSERGKIGKKEKEEVWKSRR
jgi:hypothetical protein